VTLPINISKWQDEVVALHEQYSGAKPFPHIVLDNFFDFVVTDQIREDFPTDVERKGWFHWQHFNQNKHGLNNPGFLPESIRNAFDFLNGNEFILFLEKLTGIDTLIADPTLEWAGLHVSKRNGIGAGAIRLYIFAFIFIFYGSNYLFGPVRFFKTIYNLLRSKHESRIEHILYGNFLKHINMLPNLILARIRKKSLES
jgi:hypothetical protein